MKVAVYTLRTTAVITAGKIDTVDIKSRSKVYRPPGMKLVFRTGKTVDVSVVCSVSCDADETGTCETVHAALPRSSPPRSHPVFLLPVNIHNREPSIYPVEWTTAIRY